ncbi:MAG: CarD family transcriptional regulator [Clostridia bacterium]
MNIDLLKYDKYKNLLDNITKKYLSIKGLTTSQKAHLISSLNTDSNVSSCIICVNDKEAQIMLKDISFFSKDVVYFPARDIVYHNVQAKSRDIENERLKVINKIIDCNNLIIVTTIDAVIQQMVDIKRFKNINIKLNDNINLNSLTEKLISLGYENSELVSGIGQYSIRGNIIDIFPVSDLPIRMELDFDTVVSLKTFDNLTGRSIDKIDNFKLNACSEFYLTKLEKDNVIDSIDEIDVDKLNRNEILDISDKYFNLLFSSYSFLDYLNNYNIYINEPLKCIDKVLKIFKDKLNFKFVHKLYTYEDLDLSKYIYLDGVITNNDLDVKRQNYTFSVKEINFVKNNLEEYIHKISRTTDKIILFVFPTNKRVENITNILKEYNIDAINITDKDIELKENNVYICQGVLSGGFEYIDFNIELIVEVSETRTNKRKKDDNLSDVNTFEDLSIGDYVVHENHGIGIYRGIETVNVDKVISDYIKIEYLNNANIFVNISSLDLVKKYMCSEDFVPKLNSLGSNNWVKTKNKVMAHIEEVAKELVLLYAKRQKIKGHIFSKDTVWQKDFENDFEYDLTYDQEVSLEEIKSDMESDIVMDRLLCGDVGYGKTEVALRATFKAVMDSKQVAYLVPTTVLCLQQTKTFKDRMEKYGARVEMLSRFKSKKEQLNIIKDLINGKIDVVIGTHRLLSKDVFFKDLGLLVIDEEHRFGVKAKEEIKMLKSTVDTLSMTATPIPRTLHMSMLGIRGMSKLNTPPVDRIPVRTYVIEYDMDIIKNAIVKEINRDGQVFYLYNRVDKIEEVTNNLRKILPNINISFAHGKMTPNEVEDIMAKFIDKKIDVLVCTTILESGIDIPNANTIIIENADRLRTCYTISIKR